MGDLFSWLLKLILILGAAGLAAGIVAMLGIAPIVLLIGEVGALVVLAGTYPETENHRLMIESTRFLNNQLIIEALGPDNATAISSGQKDVKAWLLNKFQSVAENDFIEYNARPYQDYSLPALQNLADFATDPDVRNGAQMLLEYSAAKFAVGSNQGRRLVPFRRRLGAVRCILGPETPASTQKQECVECYVNCDAPFGKFFEIFHPTAYADYGVSLSLLFNGQTQQLLNNRVPIDIVDSFAATSQFIIDPLITDLAIRKEIPYLQRIHHAGYEVYSSSSSALITAGGIQVDHADYLTIGGVPISTFRDQAQDVGGGLPTTVMFTGDPAGVKDAEGQSDALGPRFESARSRMTIGDFITFRGNLNMVGSDENGFTDESFTDNVCVWRNFACGTNVTIPPDIVPCLVQSPNQLDAHWFFFNSSTCADYTNGPKFFFVLYLICQDNQCSGLLPNRSNIPWFVSPKSAGFLEVVDNPSDPFDVFRGKVLLNNPQNSSGDLDNLGQGCLTGGDCTGHYHTVSGHDLELALRGHQDDSEKTGITSVDSVREKDLSDWHFAEGDIISSQGRRWFAFTVNSPGLAIIINNPRLGTELILDFSDPNHPCRRSGPGNNPCTQQ